MVANWTGPVRVAFLAMLAIAAVRPAAPDVRIREQNESATIEINGEEFTTLHFGKHARKPYLHPLRTASGKIVTRDLGVWLGHGRINGVDYWEVDPSQPSKGKMGAVVFRKITSMEQGVDRGSLLFMADWVDPDGAVVVTENRTMAFSVGPEDSRVIDIDFRMEPRQRIAIADHTGGILGLRLGAAFEEKNGGRPRIFTGDASADDVTGKRSPWLDYMAIVQGERVGVLIMDHPRNHNFPTRWKVRTFASIFATPFAELDYYNEAPLKGQAPKTARDAGISLEKGEPMRFRYRIAIHPSTFDIDQAWRDYCQVQGDRR